MADRNILPLGIGAAIAFTLGLIASLLYEPRSIVFTYGYIGLGVTFVVGLVSVAGERGDPLDTIFVAVLRALLAAGAFIFLYICVVDFLKLGNPGWAVLWLIIALGLAGACAGLRIQPPRAPVAEGERSADPGG